ncbi:hypothetical protein GTC6_05332 [Gordonia terrae C-6]|uniref:Helicase ATP-binding domain-containing protein n=1 Tax=Gordonia terrae C-6 TaxID=1316928 RepID=R7YCP0_9ACTN|nr:DEAD/DEAH box helicase family protein [Gordonia terrae]EON33763.1 hypothetical protein GTC6_05332 [Gordonia terrae C-6]
MAIDLFQFQRTAASALADRFIEYLDDPVTLGRKNNLRVVPFYQALSAITGAGKTAILAQAVNEISVGCSVPPIFLWLSKGRVVVRQAYANLAQGGAYHHLLGDANVRLLADYSRADVEQDPRPQVYFATVGTFNRADRQDSSLRIFRAEIDTTEDATWDALKKRLTARGERRPLIVVYDEAHNFSDLQTELLLEQEPNGFLLASATLRAREALTAQVIQPLQSEGFEEADLITPVPSAEVVSANLVKSSVSMIGMKTPMEESISQMHKDFLEAESAATAERLPFKPKAIYVCNTNMVADDAQRRDDPKQPFKDRQAPPILIWRHLTENLGVPPSEIAVYADLRTHKDFPLPDAFNLYNKGNDDYERFTAQNYRHIIFNLALQEGWDDPAVYFAYVDKSMESSVQVSQVIGRVLRQPGVKRYQAQRLNTAHFYVRVDRNDVFASVVDEVRESLGGIAPEVTLITTSPGKKPPVEFHPTGNYQVAKAAIDNTDAEDAVAQVIAVMSDYSQDDVNTRGRGEKREATQKVGGPEAAVGDWEDFEQSSQVSARWVFRREVSRRYRPALNVMSTEDAKFDARIGFSSPAFDHIVQVADRSVGAYLDNAVIKQQKPNPYVVGPILAREDEIERFDNSVHVGYDGLNTLETDFARAIDKLDKPWARNKPNSGYGIPLISIGSTTMFYPDFLLWDGNDVVCLETKGEHLVQTDAGRKLLSIVPNPRSNQRLVVRLISKGNWDRQGQLVSREGYTLWGLTNGQQLRTTAFQDLDSLAAKAASA